jgi:hypothetical protein
MQIVHVVAQKLTMDTLPVKLACVIVLPLKSTVLKEGKDEPVSIPDGLQAMIDIAKKVAIK